MKSAIALLLLAVLQNTVINAMEPKTYFQDLKGNLTKIEWAHAVNSKEKLDSALKNDSVLMLEADVVMGKVSNITVPVMGHSDTDKSNTTLLDFLSTVEKENKKKGVKLDFKSTEALHASKDILQKLNTATYPVFINADILAGPNEAKEPTVKADEFLKDVKELTNVTLSLGWTTSTEKEGTAGYTEQQVSDMLKKVQDEKLSQPITYPVRAIFAVKNETTMQKLVEKSNQTTLTIWSHEDDKVSPEELSKLVKKIGVTKVYLDVPASLKAGMNVSGASGITVTAMSLLVSCFFVNYINALLPHSD